MGEYVLCVVVHDDGHAVHVKAICLGHHTLAESVGDVVGAEESDDHNGDLRRNDTEHGSIPAFENSALKLDVRTLAAWEDAAGVTRLADGSLDEGVEVPAAVELILHPKTTLETQLTRPLCVDLAFQIEGSLLVCDIAGCDKEGKSDPQKECVPCEESTVVQQDSGPAYERRQNTEGCSGRCHDEFGSVPDSNDVGVCPDVEPN